MAANDQTDAFEVLQRTAQDARVVLCRAAERPELWALAREASVGSLAKTVGGALIVDPNAFPSDARKYQTLVVADHLEPQVISVVLDRALAALRIEVDADVTSPGFRYLAAGQRVLLINA
ncbi:hypothetical protein ABFT23_02120 [Nocardioides sp. C4-1]|uniref:hypothetical protein n=1 Tax=Nocardioides sp. C4-1 TaxID=3151851 RepID=UPI0032652B21